WMWAARRGVALTERSAPFVDAYLRNATSLRVVCVGGALAVSWAFTEATGVDLSAAWLVIILAGYLVGSVWAELALARVPATTTRVASLEVREVRRYQASWVAAGG